MTPREGHACRTDLETSLCAEMARQRLPHEHRSLRFRVRDNAGRAENYAPAIVARRGPILFLVEPLAVAGDRETIPRLSRFLEQHSPEIVLVVVTEDAAVDAVPREAYDEIYARVDMGTLVARIRGQDPKGIVRPFAKPKIRDTPK